MLDAPRPAQRERRACARSRTTPAEERRAVAVAAGRWRRRRLVHAHHVRLDRAAEGRAAAVGRVDRFTDWAASQFDIGPGTVVANYAPLNFDLCLLDIWTTLEARRLRRAGRPGPRDQRRATSPICSPTNEVNVAPGGADALPAADRRDAGGRPQLPERASTRSRPATRSPPARSTQLPGAVPERAASSTSTAARRRTTASSTSSRAWPTATCRRTSRSASRCPGCSTLIRTDDGEFLDGTGTGELLVSTPFQTRGYLNAALNEGKFASHPEAGDGETTFYRHRRHRPPPRRRLAHARGPRRLLRQGPRRPGQHAGGRAGDPGAPRRDRGGGRGRARRARRQPPARGACVASRTAS